MREISINLRCDWDGCDVRGSESADDLTVEPIELMWDGETKTVDLCGDHAQFLADTWTWNGATWAQRTPTSQPSPLCAGEPRARRLLDPPWTKAQSTSRSRCNRWITWSMA
jgi:hypothetical protein